MDIWQLKIFTHVIEKQSFSKASEAIHLSQPTVSTHIKALEEHFGTPLLDRLGKKVAPTKAGKLLFSHARKILALAEETESAMAEFIGSIRGDLVISSSTIPGGYILPKLIGPFKTQFPEVEITLLVSDTTGTVKKIESGEAEMGIVGARTHNARIVQEKIIEDEMKLIIPPSHKWRDKEVIDLNMIRSEPFIAREEGSGTWESTRESLRQAGLDPDELTIAARMGNTASVIQGILNKAGISILSTIAVENDLATGRLKALTLEGVDLGRAFYLTYHKKRTQSPACRKFTEFIRARFNG